LLLTTWPEGAKTRNITGATPLHLGVEHHAPAEAVQLLIEVWPESVREQDRVGNTPLHTGIVYGARFSTGVGTRTSC
jgi:hypothetical protein